MIFTLSEVLKLTSHEMFEQFCKDFGYSTYVVATGGGHITVNMTIDQAKLYNMVN